MNIFMLAFREMEREGRKPSDKDYGKIWEKRVYQISNYVSHMQRKLKRR